jgi:hypothetical protein
MPTILQFRRGTTTQNNALTGAVGELSIDTDLDTIRVHDGSTVGGFELVQRTASQTLTNKTLTNATENNVFLVGAREKVTISATAATGTIAFDYSTQAVLYYTSNASANWTLNIRGNSGTTLNSIMTTGDALTIAFIVPQGGTAYYNTSVQVDGTTSGVTTTWSGGAPTKGNASGQDHYTYTIIKTDNATFTVFASQVQFKA